MFAAALTAVLAAAPGARAQNDDAFFKGKTVTIYVGTPVGGGYDLFGRLLSRHLGRHLPGAPTVIVSNMPGGSGVICANFLYTAAPKDGTAIGILIQTMGEEQALGNDAVRFDVSRFNWVGRITSNVEMAYVWHTVPVKTIDDVKTRETILASAGPSSIAYPLLLNAMIGTRFKLVRGYQGTQNTHLAMQRGEVEGTTSSVNTVRTTTDWLKTGMINILVQYAPERHRDLQNVPTVVELGKTAEDKALLGFLARASAVGRSFVAPPDVPPERLAVLRAAFDATMADPQFLAEIRQLKAEFDPMPGQQLQQLFGHGTELSPANRARVQAIRQN
jgi:tripartite-type tricarboxylate transporter receptor subunit TctC